MAEPLAITVEHFQCHLSCDRGSTKAQVPSLPSVAPVARNLGALEGGLRNSLKSCDAAALVPFIQQASEAFTLARGAQNPLDWVGDENVHFPLF